MELVSIRTGRQWVYDESDYQLLISPEPPPSTMERPVVWRRVSDFTGGRGSDCAMLRGSTLQSGLEKVEAELSFRPPGRSGESAIAFRLKRWPPSAVLGGDARLHRLATLLLSRSMTTEELSRVANVPLIECRELVGRLDRAALLSRSQPGNVRSRARPTDRGLFSMIRKRLGIHRHAR